MHITHLSLLQSDEKRHPGDWPKLTSRLEVTIEGKKLAAQASVDMLTMRHMRSADQAHFERHHLHELKRSIMAEIEKELFRI